MRPILSTALILGLALPATLAVSADKAGEKSSPPSPPPSKAEPQMDATIPKGSADYSKMLALAVSYKKGAITFDKLTQLVVAEKLPPHPLGCEYLMIDVPAPPPGVAFDPALMPGDWAHNFGEVAMTYFAGKLSRDEYNRLHTAAHRSQPGFPNCGRPRPPSRNGR